MCNNDFKIKTISSEKRDRSENELSLMTDYYKNEAIQIIEDILAQLQSKKQSQTMIALVSLTQYVKKEPRNGKFSEKFISGHFPMRNNLLLYSKMPF